MKTKYLAKSFGPVGACDLTEELNRIADKGWELIHIAGTENCLYIFARQVADITENLMNLSSKAEKVSAIDRFNALHRNEMERRSATQMWAEDDKGDLHP